MNIVADVMRSSMHMVPLQAPTGQLEVIPLQDISDFCICASVHFMRTKLHIISVLPNRIEKEWSLAAVASHLGKSCKKFQLEVLL